MRRYIKPNRDGSWRCTKCGLDFEIYGPQRCYLRPNYCPNCGIPYSNGEPTPFTKFEEEETEEIH